MAPMRGMALTLGVALSAAVAFDARAEWRLGGVFSETLEVVTDRKLEGENDKPAYGSTTALTLNLSALDKITSLTVSAGLVGSKFVGPGADGDFNRVDPNFGSKFTHRMSRLTVNADTSLTIRPTSETQLDDTGITDENTTQITGEARAAFDYTLNARDSGVLSFNTRIVEFAEADTQFTPTQRFGADLGLRRRFDPRSTALLNFGVGYLISDDAQNSRTYSARSSAGLRYRASPRLNLTGRLGPSLRLLERDGADAQLDVGANGSFSADWRPQQDTSFTLSLNQGFEASADGELQSVARLNFEAERALNRSFRAKFASGYTRREKDASIGSFDADREVLNASPTLTYVLDRDWRATAGYALTVTRDDDKNDAISNRAFVTLSLGF